MEKFDLESFPTSESAKKMLSYVSDGFYDESYVGKWIFQVMGIEYDKVVEIVTDLSAQFFPETATWGLMYHEIKWGLPVRENLSYEERRRLIYQRRDYRAPMTPYRMEEMIKTVTLFRVHVIDAHDSSFSIASPLMDISHPNKFKIVLEGNGNADIKKIRELVDKIKQSHTVYDLLYLENAHFEVPVRYAEAVHFRTGFYPRFNLPQSRLDGKWKLSGRRKLNGYDNQDTIDLYPVSIGFQMAARGTPEEHTGLSLRVSAGEAGDFKCRESIYVRVAVECRAPRLKLDGKWKLGGGRTLSGYSTEELVDQYPVSTRFLMKTEVPLEEKTRIHLISGAGSEDSVKVQPAVTVKTSAESRTVSKEAVGIRTSAACTAGVGDIRIYNKNLLGGGWKLNGSRKLNGGMEVR